MRVSSLLILFILFGCGPQAKLRRADRLINKAVAQGATVKTDTVYKEIITESVTYDTIVYDQQFYDTIKIETVRWKSKTKIDTVSKTVYQEVECLPDTLKIPVSVTKLISAPCTWKWWHLLVALLLGYLLALIFKPR